MTKEYLERVKDLYDQGLTDLKIAEILGKSDDSVAYYRKLLGLENKFKARQPKIDDIVIDELVNNHLTCYAISKKYNCTHCYIRRVLRDNNIPLEQYIITNRDRRLVKDNPFTNLQDPIVQYWLGFLSADGGVFENRISLGLQEKDKRHIEKFVEFLGNELTIRKVCKDHKYYSYVCSFRSRECSDFLKNLGITSNKSFTLDYNNEITIDFLRGVIDGDGYIRKTFEEVSILTGSKVFAYQLKEAIHKLFNMIASIRIIKRGNSEYYTIGIYGRNRVRIILKKLYQNAPIFLDRKYETAMLSSNT